MEAEGAVRLEKKSQPGRVEGVVGVQPRLRQELAVEAEVYWRTQVQVEGPDGPLDRAGNLSAKARLVPGGGAC